ncbi:aminotransferase class III-fold pyridoxal phosphate-dependent enzyme [Algicella marina]|uniref:Aminotransferase class III-fold pyridoxal phosphate-dependent enzyme n=1 Tax=Algicella marina TaxID=2683284 RepID=A0A6P1SZF0_9RHOB|nr:aminotransferase class III-fold pyridoxal phosphate-dependent enzyme [Algicella marina]QHQ34905.1 aminotransferase class III-fold pyridoxal phosphate-dependent enzyme [Algicella marina]
MHYQGNSLEQHWMPFTANRAFKAEPRLIRRAEGTYLFNQNGDRIIDGSSGLFCSPAGHCHPKIIEAVHEQMKVNTYTAPFGLGHDGSFALAAEVAKLTPEAINHVFFVNSGSEAVDTALKIAMAYNNARGQAYRNRFVSRERAYHGVNIGGVSLSGMVKNRETFPLVMPNVVLMRHTWTGEDLFCAGQPDNGGELAEDLQRICDTYGGGQIAAVIVEPVAGSTGVLVPPKGYLERIREICDAQGIVLIFDEVITGFGRMGENFAAQTFGVTPDIMTMAKALTNGSIPMGAVAVKDEIYDAVIDSSPDGAIEFFHGYTYSGHPAACAAGNAMMGLIAEEGLFERSKALAPYFHEAVMSLKDHPLVRDIRAIGLIAGVEVHPYPAPGARGTAMQRDMFWGGLHVKFTGDVGILAPQFIAEPEHVDEMIGKFRTVLDAHDKAVPRAAE